MDHPPSPRMERTLATFARWHAAVLDMDDASRLSVESMCRRAVRDDLHADDRTALLDRLAEYLLDELAQHHT